MKKLFILGTICVFITISAVSQTKKEWEKVQSLNSWNVYQQFLLNYPSGKYSEEAKQKQSLLKQQEPIKKVGVEKVEVSDEKTVVTAPAAFYKNDGKIVLKRKFAYVNDEKLSRKELQDLLLSDQESADMYKNARNKITAGTIILGIGTAFIIYAAVNPPREEKNGLPGLISDEEMSKWMVPVYISCGCILASLPFLISGKNQFKKSINIYNSKQTTGFNRNQKIELGLTQNGLGITYKF